MPLPIRASHALPWPEAVFYFYDPDNMRNITALRDTTYPQHGIPLAPPVAPLAPTFPRARTSAAAALVAPRTLAWDACVAVPARAAAINPVLARKFGVFGAPCPPSGTLAWQDPQSGQWQDKHGIALHGEFIFVTMHDGTIRVGSNLQNGCSAHGALAGAAQLVCYAGRVVLEHGTVTEFNNDSGTYHPPAQLKHQAGWGDANFIDKAPPLALNTSN